MRMESLRSTGRKPGRKSKGDRKPTMVYLPREFAEQAAAIARRDNLPVTAIVTRAVALYLGEPAPAECEPQPLDDQTELPLTRAS
jgi:hypothetical protein